MQTAAGEYARARKLGLKQVEEARAAGRDPRLPALDALLGHGRGAGEVSLGTMEIPLDLVAGTVTEGRQSLFSPGFLPIADEGSEFAIKWEALVAHQLDEGISEPIVAYEYLQRFYVLEGNKRVSVARFLGMASIEAKVTRVLPAKGTREAELYAEFERFWDACPVYGLAFSKPGSYAKLAKLLGLSLSEPWPEEMVRRLKGGFALFRQAYGSIADADDMPAPDAFLVYLQAFATSDPLQAGEALIAKRIRGIARELDLAALDDPISYASSIPEAKGVVPSIKGVARAMVGKKPSHLAFIYDKTPETSGWIALHELGRRALEASMGSAVRTSAHSGCADEASFERAVEAAIAEGADLIATASPRQFAQTMRAAVAHPKARFVNCSINLPSSAVRTYYARMYEVKFVMGALAACLATNHRIGYLAVSPIYGAVSEINAFALGAAMIDPEAEVHLQWVTSGAADWRSTMADAGVSVISALDFSDPSDDGKPCGLCVVRDDGSLGIAAMPIWDWRRYYELIVRALRDDSWGKDAKAAHGHARNYWTGIGSGVVRVQLSDDLPLGQRRLVDALSRAVGEGSLLPFDTRLVDQAGMVVREQGAAQLTDEQLANMRWLASNVIGSLPRQEELTADGRAAVEASGIIATETNPEGARP